MTISSGRPETGLILNATPDVAGDYDVFEGFFDSLAGLSSSAHLVQMFDSTVVRAHVSAAGGKGGLVEELLAARGAGSPVSFTVWLIDEDGHSPST